MLVGLLLESVLPGWKKKKKLQWSLAPEERSVRWEASGLSQKQAGGEVSYSVRLKAPGSGERFFKAKTLEASEVLTDWLGLERAGRAALPFAFAVDGGHLDLVGGLWFQASDKNLCVAC